MKGTATMVHKYTKQTKRSRREPPRDSGSQVLGVEGGCVRLSLPIADVVAGVRDALEGLAATAGVLVMKALLNDEVERRAGPRYQRTPQRQASRWGHEDGYVVFAGRKVPVRRPRLRDASGGEVGLERYALFQSAQSLRQAVTRRVLAGVSQRDYRDVFDGVCDGYGIERSSVSRHWKAASAEQLQELLERPLAELELVALLIDGITFHDVLLVVALGIDAAGRKHVLGLWPGQTENTQVCKDLLADLVQRGLATERRYLFVLDGAKALAKAVRATFGADVPIQRCQVHKERNVLDHLPPAHHARVRQRLRAAWKMTSYAEAKTALEQLVRYLDGLNPSAARSLEEGLEETLTVHRLGVGAGLRRTLHSTNAIESCFAITRDLAANVKHWRAQEMAQRWAATMLLAAEKRFNRVKGYRDLPALIAALRSTVPSTQEEGTAA